MPEDSLAEYKGKLDDKPYTGGHGCLPQQYPHAAYAAVITRMDRDIGRLLQLVKDLGLEDDTIVVFTSDNGGISAWRRRSALFQVQRSIARL